MTVVGWAYLGTYDDPKFLIATAIFVVLAGMLASRLANLWSAVEIGILYGYLYGVVIWGSLGYSYGFDGRTKLIFAGCALVDGAVLVTVMKYIMTRLQARQEAQQAAAREAQRA